MRMSCNGCRVLRKGCSDDCSIRPCLEWIKSPESQANATVFLAKFYGRAGLMNLINAGPHNLRPAIFRSLLYEACGRIVNPIYGSVGLLWSGSWNLCQTAVEAVLRGAPITPIAANDAVEEKNGPPLKAYDIRHVSKEDDRSDLRRVRTRCRFKRSGAKAKRIRVWVEEPVNNNDNNNNNDNGNRSPSHESSLSHQSEPNESLASADGSVEPAAGEDGGEIELDLTLGFEPIKRCVKPKETAVGSAEDEAGLCKMELGLDYPA